MVWSRTLGIPRATSPSSFVHGSSTLPSSSPLYTVYTSAAKSIDRSRNKNEASMCPRPAVCGLVFLLLASWLSRVRKHGYHPRLSSGRTLEVYRSKSMLKKLRPTKPGTSGSNNDSKGCEHVPTIYESSRLTTSSP